MAALGTQLPARVRPARVTAAQLYQHHHQRVFQLCLRLGGGDRAWAEDATHDVFVKLLLRLARLTDKEDLAGWIYVVTVNTCMTRLKRDGSVWRRVRRSLSLTGSREDPSPERILELRADLAEALRLLRELPATERVVFCMRYLDELPQQQIARSLSLSEGYVSKLLARARQHIERAGWEAPRA